MSAKLNTAVVAFEELKMEFNKKTPDDAVCGKILNKLKVRPGGFFSKKNEMLPCFFHFFFWRRSSMFCLQLLLADLGLLSPVNQIPDVKERLIASELPLDLGAPSCLQFLSFFFPFFFLLFFSFLLLLQGSSSSMGPSGASAPWTFPPSSAM